MKRIFLSAPDVGTRERELVAEAFDSGYIAPVGPMVDRFEREFAAYVGAPYAVAVSSGTAALHLALRLIDTQPGDVVIAPTLTFIGGVAPIVYEQARPLFVDSDPVSWCLDVSLLEEAFDLARQEGARVAAVMPTDLYGQACDVDGIRRVCDAHNTPLIIDAAEGVGALYHGRHAGLGGLCAAYSFNGNKIMTTSGGGMLVSDDRALIDRARYLATAARQPAPYYEHTEVGFNYRLSSLSAAVGVAQLETIEAKVARRRQIYERYHSALHHVPGLSFAPEAPDRRHSRWLTVMQVDAAVAGLTPEELRQALELRNIEARPLWKPMHLQDVFRDSLRVGGQVAEALFSSGICLPSGSALTDPEIDRVIDAIMETLLVS
jgi:dTDP-4-amino-4,6-dideoxygalactose transaminase